MEKENETCGVCSFPYDSKDHTPRVLINCGHTLCSSCLTDIIKSPKLRKCPFDNNSFKRTQKSIENFPVNFALLAVLEGRNQDQCKVHHKKLTILCLQESVKICSDCELLGEHKGHCMKKIEDLKAKGLKIKKDLEESLTKSEKNNQDFESSKNRYLSQIENKFGEFNKFLKAAKLDCRKQMENLFKGNMSNPNGLSLKQETSNIIEEINQACEKEENLGLLDRDFSSIISRFQPQARKQEVSKLSDEASRMINHLASFLVDQTKSLKSFDLSNVKGKSADLKEKEKQQQLPSTSLADRILRDAFKQVKNMFTLENSEGSLLFRIKNPDPIPPEMPFERYKKMKKVKVELEQYHSFYPGSPDLTFLSEVLLQLNNYTSLVISFAPEGLTDIHALHILDLLFCRIQNLTEIEISFEQCKITNEPILFFCNSILPKAVSLKFLTLKLGFSSLDEKSLFALAQSLSPFSGNLQTFTLRAEHTEITDSGIEKVFGVVEGVKSLRLYLDGTGITDRCLKLLGEKGLPGMKNLEQLSLDVSGTKITMEGVNAIFTGIPKNISRLSLWFEGVRLSEEVISLFEKTVCPKLKFVDDVHLRLEGKELRDKASKILERVRKDASERRKVLESTYKGKVGVCKNYFEEI